MLSVLQEAHLPEAMNTPLESDHCLLLNLGLQRGRREGGGEVGRRRGIGKGRGEVGRRRGRGKGREEGGERGEGGGEGDEAEKWEREGEIGGGVLCTSVLDVGMPFEMIV